MNTSCEKGDIIHESSLTQLAKNFPNRRNPFLDPGHIHRDLKSVLTGQFVIPVHSDQFNDALGINRWGRSELQLKCTLGRVNPRDAEWFAEHTQAVAFEQRSGGHWQ